MKKILAIIMTLCICTLLLCGCSSTKASDAPTGMKLASDPQINKHYSLYIPEAWVCDMTTGITSAYVSSVDRSNISVSYEMPKENTIKDYWENKKSQFNSVFESFEVVEEGVNTKLGETDAARYVYRASYGGNDYQFIQLFAIKGVYIFTFTYTALNQETELGYIPFDRNLDAVYKIIENFRFN